MQTEKNIWLKVLSMILTLALLISCVPNQVYALAGEALAAVTEQEETAETIETSNETKRGVYEVTELREANVKHFALEDGTYTAVMYGSAVHTKDADGNWQDIDNRLSDFGSEFSTSNARIKFAKKITGNETLFALHDGNRKITMSLNNAIKKTIGAVTNHTTEFDSDATQLQKLMTLDNLSSEILYTDILDGVDLQYVVESLNVKENIIVKERKDSYQYTFTIKLNNLEAEMTKNGSVRIYDPSTKEAVYNIPAGFMYDANGEYSTAVTYTLENSDNGEYSLTVTADAAWINTEDRAFPVVIDPTISPGNTAYTYDATFISLSNVNINSSSLGYFEAGTKSITFWKMHTLPTLPAGYYISDASFIAGKHSSNSTISYGLKLGVYKVISDWDLDTFNYLKYANNNIGECVEYAVDAKDGTNQSGQYIWDITQIVREWYDNPTTNYGIAIRDTRTSTSNYYYRFAFGSKALPIRITYKSMRGLEDYWSHATQNVGKAGTGYVNKATGELTFTIGTMTTTDALFGHTTALVYNQAFAGRYFVRGNNTSIPFVGVSSGYGMKLNINESIVAKSFVNTTDDVCTYYIWTDADGTEHEFYPVDGTANTYQDSDGLQLTLTSLGSGVFEIVDMNHNIRTFSRNNVSSTSITGGYVLQSMTDKNGNQLIYSYTEDGKVEKIQILPLNSDLISQLKFSYNSSGLISQIETDGIDTAPEVKFYYSPNYNVTTDISPVYSGYLKKIEYINKNQIIATASYEYDSSGKLIVARDDTSGYYVKYTYSNNKVTYITEYANSESNFGQSISLSYGDGYTEIRSSGNDEDLGTDDDLITVYVFDGYGRVISTYSTDVFRTKIYGASSGEYETQENVKNNLKSTMTVGGAASNYIVNGGFENFTNGTADGWYKTAYINFPQIYSMGYKEHDNYCAKLSLAQNRTHALKQRVFLPAGNYTLSLDVFTNNAHDIDASIVASSISSSARSFSTKIPTDEGEVIPAWTNLALSFDVVNYNSTGGEIFEISISVDCSSYPSGETGSILVDNVMLEKSVGQSGYSMVEFGNFEDYSVTWGNITKDTYSDYWVTPFSVVYENTLLGNVLKVDPSTASANIAATQTIYWNATDSESNGPKSFIISGMAKGTQQYASGDFYLQLYVLYEDGEYSTIKLEFQNECNTWQFVSKTYTTEEKAISRIDIRIVYNNPGIAYFDNIYVTQVLDDFAVTTEYDEDGRVIEQSNGFKSVWYSYGEDNKIHTKYNSDNELYLYTYEGNLLKEEEYSIVTNPNWENLSWESKDIQFITRYAYNEFGQMTCRTVYQGSPYGVRPTTPYVLESYTYETTEGSRIFGALCSASDNPRNTTEYFYDTVTGQLLAEIHVEQKTGTCYTYNTDGSIATVMPATYTTSDGWSEVTDAQSVTYTYYDNKLLKGIFTETTNYYFYYDSFGNPDSIVVGPMKLAGYDYYPNNGKLKYLRYGNGTKMEYVYDALEKVSEVWYHVGEESTKAYTYSYTAYGQLYRFDNLLTGKTLIYSYDGNQRMTGYVEFKTADMSAEFSTSIDYDEKSRLQTVLYGFDYKTNQGSLANSHLEYDYEYSEEGQINQVTLKAAGNEHDLTYSYNDNGWIWKKDINSGTGFQNTVYYDYYAAGVHEYSWVESYQSTMQNGSNKSYYFYYDDLGNITKIYVGQDEWYRYVYDDAGQLIREDNALLNKTYVYTYDNGGNLLTKQIYALTEEGETPTVLESTYAYGYGAYNWGDLLLSYRGVSFQYDRMGNPLSYYNGRNYTFTWEQGRRLATAQVGTYSLSFAYNDEGIRTSKMVNGIKHTYHLNGSQIITEEWATTETGGTVVQHMLVYLYDAAGSPIGMQYRNSSFAEGVFDTYWFEKNLQGDIVTVCASSGVRLISYVYDAWGNFTATYYNGGEHTSAIYNPFFYRGYYYDSELAMYYLQSRYYDPAIGRFINADNNFSNNNLFMYCANNPANASDPDGHHWYYLWMDDLIQAVKDLLACSSNIVFGKAAQRQAYYDPQGAAELWRSRPFQDVEPSKEMQIFTEFMYEQDFVVDASVSFNLPVENAYLKIGISELLSANKNMNATYFHLGVGSSYSVGPPVSVSYSVGFVKSVNNKMDYAGSFLDIGYAAGCGFDYCWWNSSALCFTVSNSIGVYSGYDFYWCID